MSDYQPKVGILSFGPLYRETSKSKSDLGAGQQQICKRLEAMGLRPVAAGQGAYTSEELYAIILVSPFRYTFKWCVF